MRRWLTIAALLVATVFAQAQSTALRVVLQEGSQSSHGIGIMGTRGFARTTTVGATTGKEAIVSYRIELPYGVSSGWKIPYGGYSTGVDVVELVHVIVTATEPAKAAVQFRATFGGSNGTTIAAATVKESDAIFRSLAPGTVLRVGTLYRSATAGLLPFQSWAHSSAAHDAVKTGNTGTLLEADIWSDNLDRTGGNTSAIYAGVGALCRGYYPLAIVGRPHPSYSGNEVVIGFIGDSINVQNNDYGIDVGPTYPARGWNGRWAGASVPFVVFGQGGSTTGGFTGATATELFQYLFGAGANNRKVTHIVNGYGINEIRNQRADGNDAGNTWTLRQSAAATCATLGIPYVHTTLTPMSSVWLLGHASHGDAAAQFAYFVSQRGIFNDLVRTDSLTIAGCIGFIDWQDAVESDFATNGNTWAAGADSGDALHPGADGHQAMSAKPVLTPFTNNPNVLPTP